ICFVSVECIKDRPMVGCRSMNAATQVRRSHSNDHLALNLFEHPDEHGARRGIPNLPVEPGVKIDVPVEVVWVDQFVFAEHRVEVGEYRIADGRRGKTRGHALKRFTGVVQAHERGARWKVDDGTAVKLLDRKALAHEL